MNLYLKKGFTFNINDIEYKIAITPEERIRFDELYDELVINPKEYATVKAKLKSNQKSAIELLKIIFKDQYENEDLQDILFWGGDVIDFSHVADIVGHVILKLNAPAELSNFDEDILDLN